MKAILTIKSEHKWLQAMLYTLEQLVLEIENGANPDFRILHGITTYIDRFINTFHHPKEDDFLLPALLKRCPEAASLVAEIQEEHVEGERLFVELIKALSAYEFSKDLNYSKIVDAVCVYAQFEKTHAMKEEKRILPLAAQHLRVEDWDEINTRFDDNEDPVFGKSTKTEFRRLYTVIVNRVPAPYGLGNRWEDPARK